MATDRSASLPEGSATRPKEAADFAARFGMARAPDWSRPFEHLLTGRLCHESSQTDLGAWLARHCILFILMEPSGRRFEQAKHVRFHAGMAFCNFIFLNS